MDERSKEVQAQYPYRLPMIQWIFAVHRQGSFTAYHLSCGHTVLYGRFIPEKSMDQYRLFHVGKRMRCYKKHDATGMALPADLDPQQKADVSFFSERQQCFICGETEDRHSTTCKR